MYVTFLIGCFKEYMDEICPYATFELAKQPQGESTFSGNIYSGPYHSVRGSFVYHQPKPSTSESYNFVQVNKTLYQLKIISYKYIRVYSNIIVLEKRTRIHKSPSKREKT